MTAASPSPAGIPPPGTYVLDPERSTVRADVKAMFGLMTVRGKFRVSSGELDLPGDIGSTDGPVDVGVQVSLDAASYDSGMGKRDRDVASPALLDSATYPEITFTGRQGRRSGDGWVLIGTVTAHGTSKDAEVAVDSVRTQDGALHIHATAQLDRTMFGVTKKKGMVGRDVTADIDIVATARA